MKRGTAGWVRVLSALVDQSREGGRGDNSSNREANFTLLSCAGNAREYINHNGQTRLDHLCYPNKNVFFVTPKMLNSKAKQNNSRKEGEWGKEGVGRVVQGRKREREQETIRGGVGLASYSLPPSTSNKEEARQNQSVLSLPRINRGHSAPGDTAQARD